MSFHYLTNLFSDLDKLAAKSTTDASKPAETTKNEEEGSKTVPKSSENLLDSSEVIITNPFDNAYKTVKGMIQRGHGLNQIISLSQNDQQKAIKKLKGKHFLLKKNEILRGKKHQKSKKGTASRKLIRQKNLFDLKKLKYAQIEKMKFLWEDYMNELLSAKPMHKETNESEYMRLIRADFHGCEILIKNCKVANLRGVRGIVLKEGLKTFHIVTKKDKHLVVIKENCLFRFEVRDRVFEVLGAALVYRSDERIRIKPKNRNFLPRIEQIVDLFQD